MILLLVARFGCFESQTATAETPEPPDVKEAIAFALASPGDPEAGERVFSNHADAQCGKCHRIAGMEKAGPNLDGIGSKYSRKELIDQIVHPSRSITQGYGQIKLLMEDGRLLSGRLERRTKQAIRLLDAEGKQHNVRLDQVEQVQESDVSLMPEGLVKSLSRRQFADLIAYLESLKFQDKNGWITGGQRVAIPHLEEPVGLVPLVTQPSGFENPVWIGSLPGTPSDLIVLEHQTGIAWRLSPQGDLYVKHVFLDLGDEIHISNNQGLMCIAFHPDYANNGRYFLEHEIQEGGEVKTLIVERLADPNRLADAGKPSVRLLEVVQPAFNHNGGCIAFGPDGMLYAGFGDGGPQKDPNGYAQSKSHFLGSFTRIDVNRRDPGKHYAVPADNPFVAEFDSDASILPEIYATGFREPWRFSFDPTTGKLWVGDVGQSKFEEVCLVRAGENHGWNVREAYEPFSSEYHRDGNAYTEPLFAYSHGLGFSVTGGHVYRGERAASFDGVYVFGDYNTKRLWGLKESGGRVVAVRDLGSASDGIASFGIDQAGELLMVTYNGGLYRIDLSATTFD